MERAARFAVHGTTLCFKKYAPCCLTITLANVDCGPIFKILLPVNS